MCMYMCGVAYSGNERTRVDGGVLLLIFVQWLMYYVFCSMYMRRGYDTLSRKIALPATNTYMDTV